MNWEAISWQESGVGEELNDGDVAVRADLIANRVGFGALSACGVRRRLLRDFIPRAAKRQEVSFPIAARVAEAGRGLVNEGFPCVRYAFHGRVHHNWAEALSQ